MSAPSDNSKRSLDAIAGAARAARKKGPPPVEIWNPPFCGDLDMRIDTDGNWFYLGTPIGREALVRLFASVLRRDEDGRHYLVTPVEKVGITVEDAPFIAVALSAEGEGREQVLHLTTNVSDTVTVDEAHALRFEPSGAPGGVVPYVRVRGRLDAKLARPIFYDLVERGVDHVVDGTAWFGVWSSGRFFPIVRTDLLERLA